MGFFHEDLGFFYGFFEDLGFFWIFLTFNRKVHLFSGFWAKVKSKGKGRN